jgi:hypothetical protein
MHKPAATASSSNSSEGIVRPGAAEYSQPGVLEQKVISGLTIALATLGLLLRIQRYVLGRSFRGDEAALALAIQGHTLPSLASKPLGGSFTAPVSFLLVEKLISDVLGQQDFIFRLFPLVAGVLSVILMFLLARRMLGGVGALFCVGALAMNWTVVFYSSDLKQYSSDILFAVILYSAAARYAERPSSRGAYLMALTGIAALSFSHPAIFLLACIGPVLLIQHRRQPALLPTLGVCASWAIAFLILYLTFYRSVGQQAYIVDYWNDLNGLMPMPPWRDPSWFPTRTGAFLTGVVGLPPYVLLDLGLYVLGLVSFCMRGKWQWTAWLLGSILFTLLGSAVANYPFKGRLILFLIPAALLGVGEGIESIASYLKARPILGRTALWITALFLLWTPAYSAWSGLMQPRSAPYKEDIKPVLIYIQEHKQPSDWIVVYQQASVTYSFYAPFFDLDRHQTIILPDYRKQPRKYEKIVDVLPENQRIWFVFSGVLDNKDNVNERSFILDYIGSSGGQILQEYGVDNLISSVHLVILK